MPDAGSEEGDLRGGKGSDTELKGISSLSSGNLQFSEGNCFGYDQV